MTEVISYDALQSLTDEELKSKFNLVSVQLAYAQNECQQHAITLQIIQEIIHRKRL